MDTTILVSTRNYDVVQYAVDSDGKLITDPIGFPIKHTVQRQNNIITVKYLAESKHLRYISPLIGTVNSNVVYICNSRYDKGKARLLNACPDSQATVGFQDISERMPVQVTIQVSVQVPVDCVCIPLQGYYFKYKSGTKDKYARIQYSSNPQDLIKKYSGSINVKNGIGFYSDDLAYLNVDSPFPLNADGSINLGDKLTYVKSSLVRSANWRSAGFPKQFIY